jgi:uncharacterized protein YwqG
MRKVIIVAGIFAVVFMHTLEEKGSGMSILERIFGDNRIVAKEEPGRNLSKHRQYLDSLRKPAIGISKGSNPTFNKIGGLPMASSDFQWPKWNDKPLAFLCQIDLETMPKSDCTMELPSKGLLYFFYDAAQSTWGFDPKDRGSWKVIFVRKSTELKPIAAPFGLSKNSIYIEKYINLSELRTYPDYQDERVTQLALDDLQGDEYAELCLSVFGNQPAHHFFGYPSAIQGNDMDLESHLVSNGIYLGNADGYKDPKVKESESGRYDWRLLLQLDSDDDAGMMWGDLGMLYFWIQGEDLKKGNFDNVWMILQCS